MARKKKVNWKKVRKAAMWTFLIAGTYELYLALVIRRQRSRDTFNTALQQQNATGKQLLVLGDPKARLGNKLMGQDHDCGTVCIDDTGCPSCPGEQLVGRLEDVLPTLPSNEYVVYVAHKLEYVDNVDLVLAELQRISGGDVYVSSIEPYSLLAWVNPFVKRRILQLPTSTEPVIAWRNLPWLPGPADVEERRIA